MGMKWMALVSVSVLASLGAGSAPADNTSTFDTGADGWAAIGDVPGTDYVSTGGNPVGYISATDLSLSVVWYWQAPTKFHGDLGWAYGGQLSYDQRQSPLTNQIVPGPSVALEGGGLTTAWEAAYKPAETWTAFSVPLEVGAGWRVGDLTGPLATAADLQQVPANVTDLRVRGESEAGYDVGDLDNVLVTPEPATFALFAVCGVPLLHRRRRTPTA